MKRSAALRHYVTEGDSAMGMMGWIYVLWAITGGCWPPEVRRMTGLDPNDPAGVRGGTPPIGYWIAKLVGAIGGIGGGVLVWRLIGVAEAGPIAASMAGALVSGKLFTELASRLGGTAASPASVR